MNDKTQNDNKERENFKIWNIGYQLQKYKLIPELNEEHMPMI